MRLLVLVVAAIAISCEGVSLTPFPLEPCHVDGLAEELRCGVREVFEDRAPMLGQHMLITTVVRGDTAPIAPIVILSAITLAAGVLTSVAAARQLQQEAVLRRTRA